MKRFLIGLLLFVKVDAFSQDQLLMEDSSIVEYAGEKGYSLMDIKSGEYQIGARKINMQDFEFLYDSLFLKKLSLKPSIHSLARIKTGRRALIHEDTVWIRKGPAAVVKKAIKQKTQQTLHKDEWDGEARKGMGSYCPPGDCSIYFLAFTKDGKFFEIDREEDLKKLFTKIHTPYDAVALIMNDLRYDDARYRKVPGGFEILINRSISDCPITYADKLYFVSDKGEVELLGQRITEVTNLCY